ncbi:MAG: glycosyltransferase [Lentisphaeraceae bacterium]|nr:glycosyltransferase [Lentisphaeraceae bacterium]
MPDIKKKKRLKVLSFKASGTVIPHSLNDIQQTLAQMGHRVYVIDLPVIGEKYGSSAVEISMMDAIQDIGPDLIFTVDSVGLIAQQYLLLDPQVAIISWFFDNPIPFLNELNHGLMSSRYYLFSWDTAYKEDVLKEGVKYFSHLPWGTNPSVYHPIECGKKYDVSFVGTWSQKRQEYLEELATRGIEIDLFGDKKWQVLNCENIRFHGFADNRRECPRIYNQSKINLNISNEQLLTSLPVRIFDVAACDAFLLTDDQQDARLIFGDSLVIYKDFDDLEEKIRFYLKNDEERQKSICAMSEQIAADFTYEKRLNSLLERWRQAEELPVNNDVPKEQVLENFWKTALSLIYLERFEQALVLLSQAVNSSPQDIKLRLFLAVCFYLAGQQQNCQAVLDVTPQIHSRFAELIELYEDKGVFRTLLYGLKDNFFDEKGRVLQGEAKRIFGC